MFVHRTNYFAGRIFMVAVSLALLAGCGPEEAADTTGPSAADRPTIAAPANLVATGGNAVVTLSWAASNGATGYTVKRASTGGSYAALATPTSTGYTDSAVANGSAYTYVVSALATGSESADSAPVAATPQAPAATPATPAALNATAGNALAILTWSASSGASSYVIKRSSTSGGPYTQVATSTSAAYNDSTVSNTFTYYYVVSAVNFIGASPDSAQVSVSPAGAAPATPAGPPAAPTGLVVSSGVSQASLNWSVTPSATSYLVKRSTTAGGAYVQVATTVSTSYSDAGLVNGNTYYYVVAAANSAGQGANSAQASASPVAAGTLPAVACNNLGTPGVWKQITPPGYNADFRVADFVIDKNNGMLYLGTDSFNDGKSKGIQRSVDCGETWEHVSTGSGSDAINGGRQWTFRINPVDGRIMYANSGYYQYGLWKSYNGGKDWTDITPKVDGAPFFAGNLQMDPDDPEHLILTWHWPCNGLNNEFKFEDNVGCFHESKDGGRSWKGNYGSPKWNSEVRVLLLHGSTWLVLADNMLRTSDGGKTYASVASASLSGHTSGTLSRTNNGSYFIGAMFGLYRSAPGSDGLAWSASLGGQWAGEVADTGTMLYATQNQNLLMSSPSGDGVNWNIVAGSPTNCERIRYDSAHKTLYASCAAAGFWRMLVP